MEMIFDAPDRAAVERVAVAMAGFRQAPISRSVTDAATWAMRELAQRGPADAHRVRVPDALIAAAAAERGSGCCITTATSTPSRACSPSPAGGSRQPARSTDRSQG
jgi:hypothetical protein